MAKKIIIGLFACMFVFAFSFVSLSVSEEYSGIAKIKGKWMGLDDGKEKIKEKCTICMDIDDENGEIDGVMVCDEGGEDETVFELDGIAGDQAFSVWAFVEEEDEYTYLGMVGKLKYKEKNDVTKVSLKGIFVGEDEEDLGEEWEITGVNQGKIKAKLTTGGECMIAK